MRILKGHYRNQQGLMERSTLMVEPADGGWRDVHTGGMYKAQEHADDPGAIEIIDQWTDTDAVYRAFVPDAGECERIGMPIIRLTQ